MPTIITEKKDGHIEVGGKPVVRDMNGNWVAQLPLTEWEKRDMYKFMDKNNIE